MDIGDAETKKFNVQCVQRALLFLQPEATENELVKCFATTNDVPQSVVCDEIQRILQYGVANGFIVRNENKYSVPCLQNQYQVDGDNSDDSDIMEISNEWPNLEVFSSPTAKVMGKPYKDIKRRKKYAKRRPEPTDRETRAVSRKRKAVAGPSASPAKRRSASSKQPPQRRSASPKPPPKKKTKVDKPKPSTRSTRGRRGGR